MAIPHSVSATSVLVAIDVASRRHHILIKPVDKKRYRLSITNDKVDHDRLAEHLRALGSEVVVAFEATGNYHRAIAWRMCEEGFDVRLVSSVALARTREALQNSWDKNDPRDAQVILHMLSNGLTQRYYDPLVEGINDLQELSKTHEAVSSMKTEMLHRLKTHYYPLYFPEVDRFRHNSRSEWFFRWLHAFPTPGSITALPKRDFLETAWSLLGRKVSKRALLSDIYETARSSVALPVDVDSTAVQMYRLVIQQMRELICHRDAIERQAQQMLGDHPDYQRLCQLPGVGPIHALTILAEAGDLRRFSHYRQFLKFCGLDLATHQSGCFRGQSKLSKYGNARLRRTFWMAGQVAVRQRENDFREKFVRYIAKDPFNRDLRRKALTAVAAKMARVAHALIKRGTDYRPFYGRR